LTGKQDHVELDESGFLVTGGGRRGSVLWPEVFFKGEDNRVFMFSAKGSIFIFAKKYLTDEQQATIRENAALP
jgi:hypothetical protein